MGNTYTSPTLSGYNSNPPDDDGSQVADNEITWAKHKSKLGDPLKTYAEAIDSAIQSAFAKRFLNAVSAISSDYTVQSSDRGKLISCTNTITITLLAAGTAGDGWAIVIRNDGSGTVTVDGNGSETINGSTTVDLPPEGWLVLTSDGSNWAGPSAMQNRFPNVNADVTATDEELNNADQSATSGGGFMKGPTSSSDPILAIGTWRTPNANRPVLVEVQGRAETDGFLSGRIDLEIDESGGTTADYVMIVARSDPNHPNGTKNDGSATVLVPAGGSYRTKNATDPNNNNLIVDHREFVL